MKRRDIFTCSFGSAIRELSSNYLTSSNPKNLRTCQSTFLENSEKS